MPPLEMMLRASRVDFRLERPRIVSSLLSHEDMEVIVGSVPSRVSLCADGSAEEDEVFRDRGVQEIHATHGSASVVEDPLGLRRKWPRVQCSGDARVGVSQASVDVIHEIQCCVVVVSQCLLRNSMDLDRIEDVEA